MWTVLLPRDSLRELPGAAHSQRALAGLVGALDVLGAGHDLPAGREIRALDRATELPRRELLALEQGLEQPQGRLAHLARIVRRNVGGHADGDARRAVDQKVRKARRQHHRLALGAVVVRPKMDGVFLDLAEQLAGHGRKPALGVAHGRSRIAVERAEIAGTVDQLRPHREGLRQAYQGVVNRRVAVRVVAAHHVAHDLRALAVLGVGRQVLLPHRVQDAALDRLQAVTHVGQRPRR